MKNLALIEYCSTPNLIAPNNDLTLGNGNLRAKAMTKRMIDALPNRCSPSRIGGILVFLYCTATAFLQLRIEEIRKTRMPFVIEMGVGNMDNLEKNSVGYQLTKAQSITYNINLIKSI